MSSRFYAWLDRAVFPRIVAYATHPLVILVTVLLIVPLVVFSSITAVSLLLGNYTNVVSASVASIVLMHQLRQHTENKHLHQQTQAIGAAQQAMQLKHAEVATDLTNSVAALRQQVADCDDALAAHLVSIHAKLGDLAVTPSSAPAAPRKTRASKAAAPPTSVPPDSSTLTPPAEASAT